MHITRRKLIFGLLGLSALPIGASIAWGSSSENLVRTVLEKRLGNHIVFDEPSLSVFVKDFLEHYGDVDSKKWQVLRALAPVYRYSDVLSLSPLNDAIWWLEKDVLQEYLLGTDYFYYERYPSDQPLVYRGLYRPRQQPCRNPFARFDLESKAV